MATPTLAEIKTMIGNAVKHCDELRKYGHVNTPNFIGLEDTLGQSLESNYIQEIGAGLAAMRSQFNSALLSGSRVLDPLLRELGLFIKAPETDPVSIAQRMFDYMLDVSSDRITSRQFTFGTPVAGVGNAGNGTLNRLTKDMRNLDIENGYADAKAVKCLYDSHSGGIEHEEDFEIRGEAAARDDIQRLGSGKVGRLTALSAKTSQTYVGNPSWSLFGGTIAVPTSINDWTVTTSLANFEIDQTNYYRDFYGDSTPASLKIKANDTIAQAFTVKNAKIDPYTPYYAQIAFNRAIGAGDGTLTLTVGGVTAAVALVAQAGWNILRIAIGQSNWYRQFNSATPLFSVALSARSTGYVLVDDFIFAPCQFFDGSWYAPVGGSTPWRRDDTFTFTDTEVGAKIQQFLWRYFGVYWPHSTGGGITWADPA